LWEGTETEIDNEEILVLSQSHGKFSIREAIPTKAPKNVPRWFFSCEQGKRGEGRIRRKWGDRGVGVGPPSRRRGKE